MLTTNREIFRCRLCSQERVYGWLQSQKELEKVGDFHTTEAVIRCTSCGTVTPHEFKRVGRVSYVVN